MQIKKSRTNILIDTYLTDTYLTKLRQRCMASIPLTICLFGPPRILVDGKPLPRARTRSVEWLLALLALRQGRAVSRTWLAGTLWPDSQESQALQNLRHDLVVLRKSLGPEAARLQSPTRDTLTLELEGAEVDLVIFDRAMRAGDPTSLQSAIEVYTGPLLEGCYEEWALTERRQRAEQCREALETLAGWAQSQGEREEAIRYLRRAQTLDPLRDTLIRALMTCLAAAGDVAAAGEVYREFRQRLHEEVAGAPDAETTLLFQQLRARARATARLPAGPASSTVAGPAHLARTATSTAATDSGHLAHPAASTPVLRPIPLPSPLTELIGRETEVAAVRESLEQHRLVTLIGAGGVGKTRLALEVAARMEGELIGGAVHMEGAVRMEVAARMEGELTGGAVWAELAPLTEAALLLPTLAAALGIRPGELSEGETLQNQLAAHLSQASYLLILDNCEHLLDAVADLVLKLLSRCATLRVLATSRQRLGLTGELVWRVPSLSFPPETEPSQRGLPAALALDYPAVRLFVERAVAVRAEFHLAGNEDIEAVCRICRRLDGIPLALELTAARVNTLSISQIVTRLDDLFRLLTGGSRTALPRQQSLRALINWSYDLLDAQERLLLARLSIFAGGWSLEAAESVGTDESLQAWDVLDLLTSLVDKSLVIMDIQVGMARYRLLETVREYALDRLRTSGEYATVRARHRDYFLRMAEEIRPRLSSPEQARWLTALETDHDNLRLAMAFSLEGTEGAEKALRLGAALGQFWSVRGHLHEGRRHLAGILSLPVGKELLPARVEVVYAAGVLAGMQGDFEVARARFEECLGARRELGDQWGIGASLNSLGIVAKEQGDYAACRALAEESLTIFEGLGDRRGIAGSLISLGNAAFELGDYPAARACHQQSLDIYRQLEDKVRIAYCLDTLGGVAANQGDYDGALALSEECLAIKRELGDVQGIALSMFNLAGLASRRGDDITARALIYESLTIRQQLGDLPGIAGCLFIYALLALRAKRFQKAVRLWGASDALRKSVGLIQEPLEHETNRADVGQARAALGDPGYVAAFAEGRAMTAEQAIAYALDEAT